MTEAYTKGETGWIAQNVTRLRRIWLLTCLLGALIVALSPLIYELWVGEEVAIPAALSVACCLYALIQNWNNIYSYTINGIGRLTVSLICSIVSAVVYIPLAVLLGNRFGLVGVVGGAVSVTICRLYCAADTVRQAHKRQSNRNMGQVNAL